ncbi:MAG: hypothetical protein ACREMY_16225 [bacterium]
MPDLKVKFEELHDVAQDIDKVVPNFSQAAQFMISGAQVLGGDPRWPSIVPPYFELSYIISEILSETAKSLTDTVTALHTTAAHYAKADRAAAAEFKRLNQSGW